QDRVVKQIASAVDSVRRFQYILLPPCGEGRGDRWVGLILDFELRRGTEAEILLVLTDRADPCRSARERLAFIVGALGVADERRNRSGDLDDGIRERVLLDDVYAGRFHHSHCSLLFAINRVRRLAVYVNFRDERATQG